MDVPITGEDLGISAGLGAGGVISSGLALFGSDSTPDRYVPPEAAPASSGRFGSFQGPGYRPRVVGSPGLKTALDQGMDTMRENYSPGFKADLEARAAETDANKDAPLLDRAGMFVRQSLGSPARAANTLAEGAGNVLPTMAGGRLLAGASKARNVAMGIGGVLGAGAIKSNIYDTTYDTLIKQGVPPEVARAAAETAQAYTENPALIAAGAAAGVAAGRFGADEALIGAAGGGIDDVAHAASRGILRSAAEGAAKEIITEGPQESLETYLGNLGAIGAGAKMDPGQGVLESGVKASIMAGIPGAGGEVVSGVRARRGAGGQVSSAGEQPGSLAEDEFTQTAAPIGTGPASPGSEPIQSRDEEPLGAPIAPIRRPAPAFDPTTAQIVLEAEILGGDGLKALMDTGMSKQRAESELKRVRAVLGPKAPAAKGIDKAEDRKAAQRRAQAEAEGRPAPADEIASFDADPLANAPRPREGTPEELAAYLEDAQHGILTAEDEATLAGEMERARSEAQANLENQAYESLLNPPKDPRLAQAKIDATRNFDDQTMAPALESARTARGAREEIAAAGGPAFRLPPLMAAAVEADSIKPLVDAGVPGSPSQLRKMLEKAKASVRSDEQVAVSDQVPSSPIATSSSPGIGPAGPMRQFGEVGQEARTVAEGVNPVAGTEKSPVTVEARPAVNWPGDIRSDEVMGEQNGRSRDDAGEGSEVHGESVRPNVARETMPSDSEVAAYFERIAARVREIKRAEPNLPHRVIAQRVNQEFGTDNRLGRGREALDRRIVDEILKGQENQKTTDRGNYPGGPVSAMLNSRKDTGIENDPERALYEALDRQDRQQQHIAESVAAKAKKDAANFAEQEALPQRLEESIRNTRREGVESQPAVAPANEPALGEQIDTVPGKTQGGSGVGIREVSTRTSEDGGKGRLDGSSDIGPSLRGEGGTRRVESVLSPGKQAVADEAPKAVEAHAESVPPKAEITKAPTLYVQIGDRRFEVKDFEDASKRWEGFRNAAWDRGATGATLPRPIIVDQDGNQVARIAQNGRIFPPSDGTWQSEAGQKPLYIPSAEEAPTAESPEAEFRRTQAEASAAEDRWRHISTSTEREIEGRTQDEKRANFTKKLSDAKREMDEAKVRAKKATAKMMAAKEQEAATVPVERPKAVAEVEATEAKPQTPTVAAEKVADQIERVVDTQGVKSAKDVHERVMAALQEELDAAKKVSPFKEIEYRTDGMRGNTPNAWIGVDGRGFATLAFEGLYTINPKTKIEIDIPKNMTHAKVEPMVKLAIARHLTPKAGSIRIQIPGDGTFTIARNIVAIQMTLDRIQRGGAAMWKSVVGYKPGPAREAPKPKESVGGPVPIIRAMLDAASDSLLETAADVSAVRYGAPGTILFEYKGDTYSAQEPTDIMPAKDTKGTDDEASRAWAAKQIRSKAAKPVEKPKDQSPERADLIEKIVAAAAAGRPKLTIHEIFELKGTDGKWYGAGGMPQGVRMVEPTEKRSKGFGTQNEQGIGVGQIKPTREAQEQRLREMRESNDAEFRKALEEMPEERLKSQAEYWLKEEKPATDTKQTIAAARERMRTKSPAETAAGNDKAASLKARVAAAKENLERAKAAQESAKGKRDKAKLQPRIDALEKEHDDARRAEWEYRDERLKTEGDPAQKLIAGKRFDQVDEKALTPIVRAAVEANPKAKEFTKAQLDAAVKSFATNEWTPFYGSVIDKGLEKAVDNSLDVKLGEIVQKKALEEIAGMAGLEERTGYGQKDRFKYREEVKRSYRAGEIEKILEEARADNEKGLAKKAEDERIAAQQAELERKRVEDLKAPVPPETVKQINGLTNAEYAALVEEPVEGRLTTYPTDALSKRLGDRGFLKKERDPLAKTDFYTNELTPAGLEMAKAVKRYDDRLKVGIPFAERVAPKTTLASATPDGDWRIITGTFERRPYYSDGHWIVEGEAPSKRGSQEIPEDKKSVRPIERTFQPKKGIGEEVHSVSYFESENDRLGGLIVLSNGSVFKAPYFDYVKQRFPDAKMFSREGAENEVYFKAKDGHIVGIVMPLRTELPAGAQALVDAAKERTLGDQVDEPSAKVEKPKESKIGDFGEKIGGARKDVWSAFQDRMKEAEGADILTEPLSKVWPEPDYEAMIEGGADPWTVAFMHASRDEVPAKPRVSYRVASWAKQTKILRDMAFDLVSGKIDVADARKKLSEHPQLLDVKDRAELYQLVGHGKSLSGVRIRAGSYSLIDGVKYNPPKTFWTVEKKAAKTAFSNWPNELARAETREAAVKAFKEKYDSLQITPAANKTDFVVYTERKNAVPKFFVGKKLGRNIIQLGGPFETVKEARAYRNENQAALETKLEEAKKIPPTRRETNEPRVGEDMRNGQDVTKQLFEDSFGFRGVEFGNWVGQKKRQADLNDAFDALMDMAAILGVPPKSLSLNGELGLAFGARGGGGVGAAAAHYEPDKVVINITKEKGAGSIGHEWFHAVDNYFSRKRGERLGHVTESPNGMPGEIRQEMLGAFRNVMNAIKDTALKARSWQLDKKRSSPYWTTSHEMAARAYESYLISKLQDQNASNDYLANIVDEETWKAAASLGFELDESYPYPTAGEIPKIREAFDNFFKTVQTKETDKGVAMFDRPNETTTEADWENYNGRHDTTRTAPYKEAIRDGIQINGATRGVRVVDFEGDVDKSILTDMSRQSAKLASPVGTALRLIEKVSGLPIVFGGFTPSGNLHGVMTDGKIFVNYLATHQMALAVERETGEQYQSAFARLMTDVLIHESAHYAEPGHGDAFVAELERIKAALEPFGLKAISREFAKYAYDRTTQGQTAKMYGRALTGWREGERRGREAAARVQASSGGLRTRPDVAERLYPQPRGDTRDSEGAGIEGDGSQGSLFAPDGDQAEGVAGPAFVRGADGRVKEPSFSRKPPAPPEKLSIAAEGVLNDLAKRIRDVFTPVKVAQEAVEKKLGKRWDVRLDRQLTGIPARADHTMGQAESLFLNPLMEIVRTKGLDFDLAGEYARAVYDEGMDAKKRFGIMERAKGKRADYEEVRKRILDVQRVADDYKVKMGLATHEEISDLRDKRGDGYVSTRDHPLIAAIQDLEKTVIQAERNRTLNDLAEFVEAADQESLGTVSDGFEDGGVHFRRDGAPMTINLPDKGLREAMDGLSDTQLDNLTQTVGALTRWTSRVNTQLSPVFSIRNTGRDWGGAILFGSILHGAPKGISKSVAWEVLKNEFKAMRGVVDYLKAPEKKHAEGSWAAKVAEASRHGAIPGYLKQMSSIGKIRSQLEEALKSKLSVREHLKVNAGEARAAMGDKSLDSLGKAAKIASLGADAASRAAGWARPTSAATASTPGPPC